MHMAALTFVIPAWNAGATLDDTLRSVAAQTRADWSVVVVDDGSTDDTADVAGAWAARDARIRLVRQANRGLAGARNRGMSEPGVAEVLCFLDADDVVVPRFAEVMLAAVRGFDIAPCWYAMVGPQLTDLGWVIRTGDHDVLPANFLEYNPHACGALVVRSGDACKRAMVQTLHGPGLFDTSLPVHEDWDAWLRLAASGARWAPVVHEALFCYRLRAGSMSGVLETMWRVGLEVIDRAPAPHFPAHARHAARRRWTIRHIARAAARGDEALALRLQEFVGALSDDEAGLLGGSLRWALCREHHVAPDAVSAEQAGAWRARAATLLGGWGGGENAAEVLEHLRFKGEDGGWDALLTMFSAQARADDTLVIYGLGRNGRDLVEALERRRWTGPVAWMDDQPGAQGPMIGGVMAPRLRVEDLSANHVVVVTPDQSASMVAGLRQRGIERILVRGCGPVVDAPVALHHP